jgi:hypothetical protein
MITVHKYSFPIKDQFTLRLPKGAEILLVDEQEGNQLTCIWAKIDTEAELVQRKFFLCGTGTEVPPNVKHVASFQQYNGTFIWHLWEPI